MYSNMNLVNKTYAHHHPDLFTSRDIKTAEILNTHVALTADQVKLFGLPRRRLSHMVKYGWLYRYKLYDEDPEYYLSVYTVGPAARHYLGYPVIGLGHGWKAYSMVLTNYVLLYLINNASTINFTISYHKHIQAAFKINNPTGIYVPKDGFDPNILSLEGVEQAVVVLKDKSYARPDLPVRYVFTEELDPLHIKFYAYESTGMVEAQIIPQEVTTT